MIAQPAALLFFIAQTLRDGKPLERFLESAVMRGHHAGQCRRELRTHRYFAIAFVGKIKKLTDNFRAAFFRVDRRRIPDRTIPSHNTVTARHFAPTIENVIAGGEISWKKIAEAGKRLHRIYLKNEMRFQSEAARTHANYEKRVRLNKL